MISKLNIFFCNYYLLSEVEHRQFHPDEEDRKEGFV